MGTKIIKLKIGYRARTIYVQDRRKAITLRPLSLPNVEIIRDFLSSTHVGRRYSVAFIGNIFNRIYLSVRLCVYMFGLLRVNHFMEDIHFCHV